MVKNILFVCKHNIFRSRAAEEFFKKFNKNIKWKARSAGIIKWRLEDLKLDKGFEAVKKVSKEFGIKLEVRPRALDSGILEKTDLVVIVADDVSPSIFNDRSFKGKVILWKIKDIKIGDKDKEGLARKGIVEIEKRVKKFAEDLK